MKIWVYAISKNERQFCERFMASCAEADGVSVLDTGSEDGTAERLIELGADVGVRKFTPWRFDFARNAALDMVRRTWTSASRSTSTRCSRRAGARPWRRRGRRA